MMRSLSESTGRGASGDVSMDAGNGGGWDPERARTKNGRTAPMVKGNLFARCVIASISGFVQGFFWAQIEAWIIRTVKEIANMDEEVCLALAVRFVIL